MAGTHERRGLPRRPAGRVPRRPRGAPRRRSGRPPPRLGDTIGYDMPGTQRRGGLAARRSMRAFARRVSLCPASAGVRQALGGEAGRPTSPARGTVRSLGGPPQVGLVDAGRPGPARRGRLPRPALGSRAARPARGSPSAGGAAGARRSAVPPRGGGREMDLPTAPRPARQRRRGRPRPARARTERQRGGPRSRARRGRLGLEHGERLARRGRRASPAPRRQAAVGRSSRSSPVEAASITPSPRSRKAFDACASKSAGSRYSRGLSRTAARRRAGGHAVAALVAEVGQHRDLEPLVDGERRRAGRARPRRRRPPGPAARRAPAPPRTSSGPCSGRRRRRGCRACRSRGSGSPRAPPPRRCSRAPSRRTRRAGRGRSTRIGTRYSRRARRTDERVRRRAAAAARSGRARQRRPAPPERGGDRRGHPLAVGGGLDDRGRAVGRDVAAGVDAGDRRLERLRVDGDEAGRRQLRRPVAEEVEHGVLADREDQGVERRSRTSEPGDVVGDLAAGGVAVAAVLGPAADEAGERARPRRGGRPAGPAPRSRCPPRGWRGSPPGRPASGRPSGGRSSDTDEAPTRRADRAQSIAVSPAPTTPTRGPIATGRPSRTLRRNVTPSITPCGVLARQAEPLRPLGADGDEDRREPVGAQVVERDVDAGPLAVADLDAEALEDREVLVDLRLRQAVGRDRPADHAAGVRVLLEDRDARRRPGPATRRPPGRPARPR